jgi:hypothetical protein
MDTSVLVDQHIDDGIILLKELFRRHWRISAAFWNQDKQSYEWKLYLSLSHLRQAGSRSIYLQLTKAIKDVEPTLGLDVDDIKLLESTHGVVKAIKLILEDADRHSGFTTIINLGGDPHIIGKTICYYLNEIKSASNR